MTREFTVRIDSARGACSDENVLDRFHVAMAESSVALGAANASYAGGSLGSTFQVVAASAGAAAVIAADEFTAAMRAAGVPPELAVVTRLQVELEGADSDAAEPAAV